MTRLFITIYFILATVFTAMGAAVERKDSELPIKNTFTLTDRFRVIATNNAAGGFTNATMTAETIANGVSNILGLVNGGIGSTSNAVTRISTNGTTVSSSATGLNFVIGSNISLSVTNNSGDVSVGISSSGGGSVDPTNAVLANIIGTGAKTNQEVIYIASAGSSPAGSDANPGSSAAPILNIDTAAFRLRGNGTVIMKNGTHAQNPNWGLWTNLVLKSQTPGMTENILGTNISAFTTIGSGVYRITYIPSSWLMYSNDGTGFIWQLGSNSFDTVISPSERHLLTPNQDYYLHGMVHLTNISTVAGLQNGSYAISNNDIYFKFADGGVPNSRTIQLPALQTTNSFGYGGQLYSSIEIIGIRSYFGNCGTVVTGTKKFVTHNCWFVGSYAEGRIDDSMQGVDESYTDAYLFNSNDGVGLTSAGTNVYPAKFINPLVVGNQDGGIDTHTFAACTISGGVLARQIRGAGSTAFGGGQNEATGTRFILNLVGAFPAGGGVFYDASRTNFYSTFICDNCTFISNTFGCFIENAATNLLLRLKGTTTFIGNGNDIVNYIDGVNQRLEEEGVIVSDKPLIYLHLGSNSNPPTKSTALYVVSASPSGVTLGNTNLTVQTLQVTGINTNGILYTGAGGQVSTAALSGLTFSGGVLTATSGVGTPAGNSGDVQFNEGGAFAATNKIRWDRANNVLIVSNLNYGASLSVRSVNLANTNNIYADGVSTPGLIYNVFLSEANHPIDAIYYQLGTGSFRYNFSNSVDLGTFQIPWKTNWVNDLVAFETVTTPQLNLIGSGVGNSSYYDAAGTEYSQFMAPLNVQSNNVTRLWTNATSGIVVAQPDGVGSNQLVNLMPGPGQYVTGNGTSLVVSNLPAIGAGGVMTKTNFVLNTLYTNTDTTLITVRAFLTEAAVNGVSSVEVMWSPSGGTGWTNLATSASSTMLTGLATQMTNSMAFVLTNLGSFYFTNTSSGAGNSAGLVSGTGQTTTIGVGPAGPTGATGSAGSTLTNFFSIIVTNQLKQIRQTLGYAGGSTNVHVDLSAGNKFLLTLTKNTHIVFTNITDSISGAVEMLQDSTGGWLVSYNTNFAATGYALYSGNTTNAGARDIISFETLANGTRVGIAQNLDIR